MVADVEQFAELVVATIKSALGPVVARLDVLERREALHGRDGVPGRDGLIGQPGEKGIDGRHGIDGKDGNDGRDGVDGKDGAPGEQGPAGRDVDPDVIVRAVADYMMRLPAPRDGKDADPVAIAELVKSAVVEAVTQIPAPKDGKDGHSPTADQVRPLIVMEVAHAVAALPLAKDGRDGADGTDGQNVSIDDVAPLIADVVQKAVAALPPAKDGEPGKSVEIEDVVVLVEKAVAALPKPEHGKDGANGTDGKSLTPDDVAPLITAEVVKAVSALPKSADPVGVLGALIDRDGHLVLTLSNGATKDVGLVVGRDVDPADVVRVIGEEVAKFPRPQDGVNGKDGLGFDDLDVVFPDGRPHLRFARGEHVKEFPLHTLSDRGVWKEGTSYAKGDGVTWAGSFWIAQQDTDVKPGDGATPWRLAVKKGADGKQGAPGVKGVDGAPGRPGLDGRRL